MKTSKDLKRCKMIVSLLDEVELVVGAIDFYKVKEIFAIMLEGGDEWLSVCKTEIKPEQLGPFAPAISHMFVEVEIGISKKGDGHVSYNYSYEHPDGGRNGKTVERIIQA